MPSNLKRTASSKPRQNYLAQDKDYFQSLNNVTAGPEIIANTCDSRQFDGLTHFVLLQELPPDVLAEKQSQIRKLQQQLRNEEMALVLLKKIRQSQLLAVAADAAAKQSAAAASSNHVGNSSKQQGQGGYGSQHRYNSQQQNYQKSSQQGAGKHGHQQGMVNNVSGAKGNSVSSREKDQYARQLAAAAQLQQQTAAEQKATADLLKQVNLVSLGISRSRLRLRNI